MERKEEGHGYHIVYVMDNEGEGLCNSFFSGKAKLLFVLHSLCFSFQEYLFLDTMHENTRSKTLNFEFDYAKANGCQ